MSGQNTPTAMTGRAEEETVDFTREWHRWREAREATLRAPYGQLSLVGTHWLTGSPADIDALPGVWSAHDGEAVLRAGARDGLRLDGAPVDGQVRVGPDASVTASRLTLGQRRLVVIDREGELAVRVYDPRAATRLGFVGVEMYPPDPAWAGPARFTAYEAPEVVAVRNVDGRHRGLALGGTVAFELAGVAGRLAVEVGAHGALHAVMADATSATGAYRFRFVDLPAPDADGRTAIDFNRVYLPPCAFADHYLCPFPPPGNTLPVAVTAGERAVLRG